MRLSKNREPTALSVLALAYARNGDKEKARQTQRQALEIVPAGADALRSSIERILEDGAPPTQTRPAQNVSASALSGEVGS